MSSKIYLGQESTNDSQIDTSKHHFHTVFITAVIVKEYFSIIGIIIHEFAHYISCKLLGLEIYSWSLFQNEKTKNGIVFGYFSYQTPNSFKQEVLVNIAPLFVNTLIGILILVSFSITTIPTELSQIFISIVSISILAKATPSIGDIKNIEGYSGEDIGISYLVIKSPLKFLAELQIFFGDYVFACFVFWIIITIF